MNSKGNLQKELLKLSKQDLVLLANSKGIKYVDTLSKLKLVDLLSHKLLSKVNKKAKMNSGVFIDSLQRFTSQQTSELTQAVAQLYSLDLPDQEYQVLLSQLQEILSGCFSRAIQIVNNKKEYHEQIPSPRTPDDLLFNNQPRSPSFLDDSSSLDRDYENIMQEVRQPPRQPSRQFNLEQDEDEDEDESIFSRRELQRRPASSNPLSSSQRPEFMSLPSSSSSFQRPELMRSSSSLFDVFESPDEIDHQCHSDADCHQLEQQGIIKHSKGKKGKCLKDPHSNQNKCCY